MKYRSGVGDHYALGSYVWAPPPPPPPPGRTSQKIQFKHDYQSTARRRNRGKSSKQCLRRGRASQKSQFLHHSLASQLAFDLFRGRTSEESWFDRNYLSISLSPFQGRASQKSRFIHHHPSILRQNIRKITKHDYLFLYCKAEHQKKSKIPTSLSNSSFIHSIIHSFTERQKSQFKHDYLSSMDWSIDLSI